MSIQEQLGQPALLAKIENLATEVAHREGLRVYDVEFVTSGGHRVLRIYIDRPLQVGDPSQPATFGTVSIDDCAKVSAGLSILLDVEDLIPGEAYDLEVSSPGLERNLKRLWHFDGAIGKKIKLRTSIPPFEGQTRKAFTGTLIEVSRGEFAQIKLRVDQRELLIPFELVEKAQVIFEMTKGQKNRSG
jgi:ribosome maturation factor RimP